VASFVYYTASVVFPAQETMLDETIFDDTKGDDNSDGSHNIREDEKAHSQITTTPVYV
jgi:hypothetical protein